MMYANDLTLQVRPHAFDAICVDCVIPNILTTRLVDCVMLEFLGKSTECGVFIRMIVIAVTAR